MDGPELLAALRLVGPPRFRQPWESGLVGAILRDPLAVDRPPWEPRGPAPPAPADAPPGAPGPVQRRDVVVARRSAGLGPSVFDEQERTAVCAKLFEFVRTFSSMDEGSFYDAVEAKATSTIAKRTGSMLLFAEWARGRGLQVVPLDEAVVYGYVQHLEETKAPPTRAPAFRSALGFFLGTFSIPGGAAAISSRRVAGRALVSLKRKRVTVKAEPLKAFAVMRLEGVVSGAVPAQELVT